ncbi:hypothetical protein [Neorhodopirellula pilleata]|uniref:Uncharacterized protein n=1 Tax=Neorhodopirellula pilleata TaxID=2714738 RepID=A0A5C6AVZ5_9BACT|nr:hypothetical protein [Neorhodopirellula pilleata]TWU03621.1 hypothetical protein Pla100_05500 [Neorhodopirellula pilleata]
MIYRKQKSSEIPGPRAENVRAASKGNLYRYTVDKFWVVENVDKDGMLQLRTRRGKRHVVSPDDPHLRKARVWERWLYRDRFEGNDLGDTRNRESLKPGADGPHGHRQLEPEQDTPGAANPSEGSTVTPPRR